MELQEAEKMATPGPYTYNVYSNTEVLRGISRDTGKFVIIAEDTRQRKHTSDLALLRHWRMHGPKLLAFLKRYSEEVPSGYHPRMIQLECEAEIAAAQEVEGL